MRDAVILGQFDDLGVNQNELDILRPGAEQEADDNGVDADGFTAAGGACNQQVRHLAQVSDLCRTGDILAQGHRQRAAHVDVVLGLKDRADIDGGANLVRDLNADGGLAGDGRFNAHTGRGKVQGDIIGQACDAADLDTGLGLQLIPGDGRAAADIQHRGLDAEAVQSVDKNVGVLLHFTRGTGLVVGARGVKQIQRRVAVRLRGLLLRGGQTHGVGVCLGGARRRVDGRTGGIANGGTDLHAGGLALLRHGKAALRRLGCRTGHGGLLCSGSCVGRGLRGGSLDRLGRSGIGSRSLCRGCGIILCSGGGGFSGQLVQHFRNRAAGLPSGTDSAAGAVEAAAQRWNSRCGSGNNGCDRRSGNSRCGGCAQRGGRVRGHTGGQISRGNHRCVTRYAAGHIQLRQLHGGGLRLLHRDERRVKLRLLRDRRQRGLKFSGLR